MLTVLWSTPRTGSTWYANYLLQDIRKHYPNLSFIKQYLNKFHYSGYIKKDSNELFQEYKHGMCYVHYKSEAFTNHIVTMIKNEKRTFLPEYEEAYRIGLLEKINLEKYPYFLHQHVQPMNKDTYFYLKNKATRNIFIYRENIVNQLASYVVAMHTQIFHKTINQTVNPVTDASIDISILDSLYDRIIYWHNLDKSGCEIIKYEDIDFAKYKSNLSKQHTVPTIDQVSEKMRDRIYSLNDKFQNYISERKTL